METISQNRLSIPILTIASPNTAYITNGTISNNPKARNLPNITNQCLFKYKMTFSYDLMPSKEYLEKLKSKGIIVRIGKTSAGYLEIK